MGVTYVVNASNKAVSEYHDLEVTGLAVLNNRLYGIKADGLVEFTGTDDEGADIDVYAETGKMAIGGGVLKRYPRLYIGGTAAGGIDVTMTTEEDGVERERAYPAPPWKGDLRERVVKPASGPKSRYVQVKFANRNGGSLELEQADLMVEGLPRRV